VLLLRFSISQMDVPTRQSYTMAVVAPEERAAASGITGVAQVAGVDMSDPERLAALDATYLADMSLERDLRLILATLCGAGRGDRLDAGR